MPVVTIPAPAGGINTRDGDVGLPAQYAVTLENWIPGPGYISTRGPCQQANAGVGTDLSCINTHPNGDTLIGTLGGDIWKMGGGAALATAFNGFDWHGNIFQDRTILCSGFDTPQIYNGTTITAGTYSGSGLTDTNLYGSITFKGRVYYWEAAQRFFWYAAAAAFQGALAKYDVSTFCRTAGYIVSMCPMTNDGGNGPDDYLAILFSSGEVLMFQGDDPASATSWQMIGSFLTAAMLGRRCWAIVGSATLVVTKQGVVDLAKALAVGPSDASATVGIQLRDFEETNTIENVLVHDVRNRILWLVNRNDNGSDDVVARIYGMDVDSRSWFRATGIESSTTYNVGYSNGRVMYAKGQVIHFGPDRDHDGTSNDSMTGGNIGYTCAWGFLDFGAPSQNKRLTSMRLIAQRISGTDTGSFTATLQEIGKTAADQSYGTATDPAPRSACAFGRHIKPTLFYTGKGPWKLYGVDFGIDAAGTR